MKTKYLSHRVKYVLMIDLMNELPKTRNSWNSFGFFFAKMKAEC